MQETAQKPSRAREAGCPFPSQGRSTSLAFASFTAGVRQARRGAGGGLGWVGLPACDQHAERAGTMSEPARVLSLGGKIGLVVVPPDWPVNRGGNYIVDVGSR